MPVLSALGEVEEEAHHTELHQQVNNLLAVQVMLFSGVGAEVPYHYGRLLPEACQGLLPVLQVLEGGG